MKTEYEYKGIKITVEPFKVDELEQCLSYRFVIPNKRIVRGKDSADCKQDSICGMLANFICDEYLEKCKIAIDYTLGEAVTFNAAKDGDEPRIITLEKGELMKE